MLSRNVAPDAPTAALHPRTERDFNIVLVPVSHPELGEIRIDEDLFAVGRNEAPFGAYAPEIVADLSRRHARIFSEYGAVYIADLDSKNGTTVNGRDVRQKTCRLQQGDEVCFGGTLCYKVQLGQRAGVPDTVSRAARLVSLTLTPDRNDLGLQPIVITHFPFLISKADAAFSRYKNEYPHQVNYLSRRHAHIFLKGGRPFVEDLGSTNGTFVGGKRLDEHAVPLEENDMLAFGGHHFVYKVSLQKEEAATEPTLTRLSPAARAPRADAAGPDSVNNADIANNVHNADKTTFVAAADSFLDIFCVEQAPRQDDEVNDEAAKQADDANEAGKRRPRGRLGIFLSELNDAFIGKERKRSRRGKWWGTALATLLLALAAVLYLGGSPERELNDLVAGGDYANAATLADRQLQRDPGNTRLQALGTEALLKTDLPPWLAALKAGDFKRASNVLAAMKDRSLHNAEMQALAAELGWIAELEQFVAARGGTEAPIRIYADEDRIRALLKRWNDDTGAHQRAFAKVASHVPAFRETYADALSHLRKLQSDDSVYLAAIDRLKAAIATELGRDQPEALEPMLQDYAEKYPRLAGLDQLHGDLRQYIDIDSEAHAQRLGVLVPLLAKVRFSTPPFQQRFRELTASGKLPSADVVRQYQVVSQAWHAGDTRQALAGLQAMSSGPLAEAASKQLQHKKALAEQYGALQKARGGKGYDDRLLAFYGALDPDEDVYFIRATAADVGAVRDKAIKRAHGLLESAQKSWSRYRDNGAIGGVQRLEGGVSESFRAQARLLAQARDDARQGARIYTQLKADYPADQRKLVDEINAEAELQRRSLLELRRVLEPAQLKAKLALLGDGSDEK